MLPLFISALLSLKALRPNWPVYYRWFSALLIFVLLAESFAIWWKYYFSFSSHAYTAHNLWIYNVALVPQYLLYMTFYYQVIRSPMVKRWIIAAGGFYFLFALANSLFFQSIHSVQANVLLVAYAIVILLTVVYFEQVRKDNEIIKLASHPLVWISLGALIFHSGDLPYMISLNYLNRNLKLATALYYIHLILNCVMYTLYIIAFLCHPPPRK
jgi:hypothetical protein